MRVSNHFHCRQGDPAVCDTPRLLPVCVWAPLYIYIYSNCSNSDIVLVVMGAHKTALAVLVVVLLLVVAVYVVITVRVGKYVAAHHNHPIHPRVSLTTCEPHLKTGDILLFVRYHQYPILSNHLYSHVAMVFRHRGVLYVAETARTFDKKGTHEHKENYEASSSEINLLRRMDQYAGCAFVMRLEHPLTPSQEKVMARTVDEVRQFPKPHQVAAGILLNRPTANTQDCGQRVMHLLDSVGLAPTYLARQGKTLSGSSRYLDSVKTVAALENTPVGLEGNNRYGHIYELVNDTNLVPPHRMT